MPTRTTRAKVAMLYRLIPLGLGEQGRVVRTAEREPGDEQGHGEADSHWCCRSARSRGLILLRKPFVVGDQIRVRDYEGTVEEITARSTRLKTYDGERVVIPNGDVYTSSILVRTAYDKRRVKFVVGIGYPDSIDEARATITRVVEGAEGVLGDPGPWVYVEELAPSSVNIAVYFWTESQQANVLRVRDRVATAIKQALDAANIDMPFPHTVVLFHDQTGNAAADAAGDRPARRATRTATRTATRGAPNGDGADGAPDGGGVT